MVVEDLSGIWIYFPLLYAVIGHVCSSLHELELT